MNWRSIGAIARKDLMEVRQNKVAWGPAIAIPLIFAILLPILFSVVPQVLPVDDIQRERGDIETLLKNLPPSIQTLFDGLKIEQMFVLYITAFMFAPLFLILPLMFSSVVGRIHSLVSANAKRWRRCSTPPLQIWNCFLVRCWRR